MLIRPLLLVAAIAAALALSGTAQAAPQRVAFEVKYSFSAGHFTFLTATAPVKVTVQRPSRPAKPTTLKARVGKKLPVGTKITVRRGKAALTLRVTARGVR
jgi:hypothetical protein